MPYCRFGDRLCLKKSCSGRFSWDSSGAPREAKKCARNTPVCPHGLLAIEDGPPAKRSLVNSQGRGNWRLCHWKEELSFRFRSRRRCPTAACNCFPAAPLAPPDTGTLSKSTSRQHLTSRRLVSNRTWTFSIDSLNFCRWKCKIWYLGKSFDVNDQNQLVCHVCIVIEKRIPMRHEREHISLYMFQPANISIILAINCVSSENVIYFGYNFLK